MINASIKVLSSTFNGVWGTFQAFQIIFGDLECLIVEGGFPTSFFLTHWISSMFDVLQVKYFQVLHWLRLQISPSTNKHVVWYLTKQFGDKQRKFYRERSSSFVEEYRFWKNKHFLVPLFWGVLKKSFAARSFFLRAFTAIFRSQKPEKPWPLFLNQGEMNEHNEAVVCVQLAPISIISFTWCIFLPLAPSIKRAWVITSAAIYKMYHYLGRNVRRSESIKLRFQVYFRVCGYVGRF